MKGWGWLIVALAIGSIWAQPATDLWLVQVTDLDGAMQIRSAANLTDRDGYDNQPHFVSDSRILYTSIRPDGQADIYSVDLDGDQSRVLFTQESEYSPTPTPDGRSFSTIRVEHDGTQRLWAFPLDGGSGRIILPKVKPVGYHVWLSDRDLALFVLGQPNALYTASTRTGQATKRADSIGRGLRRNLEGEILFVHKASETDWSIQALALDAEAPRKVVETLPGSEDFDVTVAGALLMASDSELYRLDPGSTSWTKIADLGSYGLKGITRLAISPDQSKLVIVSNR